MNFFKQWGRFMMVGALAHARWEKQMSDNILKNRRRLLVLGMFLIPVILGGIAFATLFRPALYRFTLIHKSQVRPSNSVSAA